LGTLVLRMVWTDAKVGEQQWFSAWVLAATIGLDSNKNGIDVFERLRIVGFQNPPLLGYVVFIEDSEAPGLLLVRPFSPPGLERARVLDTGLSVQIERIENQPFSFCAKNPAVRLCPSLSRRRRAHPP
jgi:hypothetical protein